ACFSSLPAASSRRGLLLFSAGCVISPRRLPGDVDPNAPGGGSTSTAPAPSPAPSPSPTPSGSPQGLIYATNESGNAIVCFSNGFTANGDQIPATVISGANTHLNKPEYLALDATADRLFVANLGGSSILVFDQISTKTGDAPPSREITGPTTNLIQPVDLAYDKARDMLYVADGPDILVFNSASTANGDAPSTRDIQPGFAVSAIFIDSANDRLYAADSTGNAINMYDSASTLGATPAVNRSLVGAHTGLAFPSGILVDSAGNLIVSNATANEITIYDNAATISGDTAPSTTIVGAGTQVKNPSQIALNTSTAAGELLVTNPFTGNIAIFVGYAGANGDVTPSRDIAGASTTLTPTGGNATVRGVAIDNSR
ncbi:MAG TPA: beta-propeller fold lactonase family protein, partial [Terriglobales bacterium]|nr:beta-propeller fold lactonase family protein [Terriglobales bacterium]